MSYPTCEECGLPVYDYEERVEGEELRSTPHSPAEPAYIAHRECPLMCSACRTPQDLGDLTRNEFLTIRGGWLRPPDPKYPSEEHWVCDYCWDNARVAKGAYQSGFSLSREFKDGGPPYERAD